jgi:nitrogenase molybdenum-iron protein alpha/beta subunit
MFYSTRIGDIQPDAVSAVVAALPISVVTQAEIEDATAAVNIALYSGKKDGACYIMKETTGSANVMVIAEGSEATDVWRRQDDKIAITPA